MNAAIRAKPGSHRRRRVAIVGGGPGGLFAAYLLQKLAHVPFEITIFEASSRLGGKLQTLTFGDGTTRYEAGAAEFYDHSPIDEDPLRRLVTELGLSTTPMTGGSVVLDGRVITNLDDVARHCGKAAANTLVAFDDFARATISRHEFYDSDDPDCRPWCDPALRRPFPDALLRLNDQGAHRYVATLLHSDLACESGRTDIRYGLQNYLMNDPRYLRLYCINGGNEQLIDRLAARIRASVQLGHQVRRIDSCDDGRLAVVLDGGHEAGSHGRFDALVLALPLDALTCLEFADETLRDAMSAHVRHHWHPAHYLRISLLFEHAFWRPRMRESFWMVDAFGGACLYDESSRAPWSPRGILGWLLGGFAARESAKLDDAELVRRAFHLMPAALGRPARLLDARVHRWCNAVNACPGGKTSLDIARRHRPEPKRHANLFVVGDYLYDSTINGVLDGAAVVAGWLAATQLRPIRSEQHGC